jgi:DNA-binding GntR family transcriptional regulator
MVARVMSNGGARVAEGDVDELRQLLQLREVLEEAIVDAVRGLREAEITWEDIGKAAGSTRQAAQSRWGPRCET